MECEVRRVFSVVADSAKAILERTTIADALQPKGSRAVAATMPKRRSRPGSTAKNRTFRLRARD
jgi:hypothetical protein